MREWFLPSFGVVAVFVTASTGIAGSWRSIAVLPVQVEQVSDQMLPRKTFDEVLLTAVTTNTSARVVGESDIGAMLSFERQKDLVGCEDTSCFAEIGGALGVDVILVTRVARVAAEWVVNMKVIRMTDEFETLARISEFLPGRPDQLLKKLPELVAKLMASAGDRASGVPPPPSQPVVEPETSAAEPYAPPPAPEAPAPSTWKTAATAPPPQATTELPGTRIGFWWISRFLTAGLAVASSAVLIAMFALNDQAKSSYANDLMMPDERAGMRSTAETTALVGNVSLGLAIAGAVAFGVTWFFDDD